MSDTRETKVFYFKSDRDIKSYLLNLNNVRNPENSIKYRGNHIQLRDISESQGYIVGKICKVREIEKPMVGSAYDPEEAYLERDIIESSHFIYSPDNLTVIIQNNNHVSTNPNSLLSQLIVKTHQNDLNGLGIIAVIRDDAVQELIRDRGSISQIKVKTTKEGANLIARESGDDVEMGDDFLDSATYTERTLSYKMNLGTVEESLITKFSDFFRASKIIDASFTIDGNRSPIKLSEFAKYEVLKIAVNNHGSFDMLDFQNKLLELIE